MTGTVTEILDCGHSYMIQAPTGRVYRRNRAHLKPIYYDGTSFQDHSVEKEKKQPKTYESNYDDVPDFDLMSFLADIDENDQALVPVNHQVASNPTAKNANILQPKSTTPANTISN